MTVRKLDGVRLGVAVSVWPDGSVTEHEPNDPARSRLGVPLLSTVRASELPTHDGLRARLWAAAKLRGLEVQER